MIQRFIEDIEKTISTTPLVLSSNIQKQFSPDSKTVYIKGALIFIIMRLQHFLTINTCRIEPYHQICLL